MNYQNSNPYPDYRGYPQAFNSYGKSGQMPQMSGQMPQFGGQMPGAQPGFPQAPVSGQPSPIPQIGAFPMAPPGQAQPLPGAQIPGMLPIEASYIENILRLNKGKLATAYFTFENGQQSQSLTVKGIIEAAGRDHLILSDPQTGMRYLMLMVYLNYVTFDEEIEYDYPIGAAPSLSAYSPR